MKETVERVHGETGRQWLLTLPALVCECRERWSLELDKPFENLSYNLVFREESLMAQRSCLKSVFHAVNYLRKRRPSPYFMAWDRWGC